MIFLLCFVDPFGAFAEDVFHVVVNSVNDLPTPFDLLEPADGAVIGEVQAITFVWEASVDVVEGSDVTYTFVVTFDGEDHRVEGLPIPSLEVTREDLGYDVEEAIDVTWTVWAYDDADSIAAGSVFDLHIDPLAVEDPDAPTIPTNLTLGPVFPNPFNDQIMIRFALPTPSYAALTIHDPLGRTIKTLSRGDMTVGYHATYWNGTDNSGGRVPSGLYFCRITTPTGAKMQRVILMR